MEIVGGFMVMMSILGFFLAIIWLIMPFVVFAVKGRQDRILEVLEEMNRRLAALENRLSVPVAAPPDKDQQNQNRYTQTALPSVATSEGFEQGTPTNH